MVSLKFSPSKVFSRLWAAFLVHIRVLFYDLDPVKNARQYGIASKHELLRDFKKIANSPPKSRLNFNVHYVFPFLVDLFVLLDCVYILRQHGFVYSHKEMPEFLFHLVFPQEFWQQGDIMLGLGLGMTLLVYSCLLTDPMLDRKFWMYLFVDKKGKKVEIVINGQGEILVL